MLAIDPEDPETSDSKALKQPFGLSGDFLGCYAGLFSRIVAPSSTNLPLTSSSSSASATACRGEAWPGRRTGSSCSEAI